MATEEGNGDDASPDDDTDAELQRLREENETLRSQMQKGRSGRGRAIGAIVLIVIGSLLLPLAAGTAWLRTTILETDSYVDTVSPLARDEAIQKAATDRITTVVTETAEIKALAEEALPEDASFLAGPIAVGAEQLIRTVAEEVITSDQFQTLWDEANELAHGAVVEVLAGRDDELIQTSDGQVSIDLGSVVDEVATRVDDSLGVDVSGLLSEDQTDTKIVLFESEQLADVQALVRLLDRLSWFTLILAIAAFVGGIALAPIRRRAVVWTGVGVTASMLVCLLGFSLGREFYESELTEVVANPDAAMALFDVLTRFLHRALRTLFVFGLLLLLGGWLAGPGARATRIREGAQNLFSRAATGADDRFELGPVPGWVASNATALRIASAVIAAIVLVSWNRPTGLTVFIIAVVLVVVLLAIRAFERLGQDDADDGPVSDDQDSPDAEPAEVP